MAEPIAAGRTRVGARVLLVIFDFLVENILDGVLHRLILVFRFSFDDLCGDGAVSVRLRFFLVCRDQLGEHAGERVDLVAAQLGAGCEVRFVLGEHAFEPEHEAVPDFPAG